MSSNKGRYFWGTIALVATLLALSFLIKDMSFLATESASARDIPLSDSWIYLLNFSSNAYFPWKIDPIWLRFGLHLSAVKYTLLHYGIFSIALYVLLIFKSSKSISAFFLSLGTFLGVILIFGLDISIAGMLAWFPAVILGVYFFCWQTRQSILTGLILAFLSLRLSSAGLYLSLIPAILAFYLGAPFKFVTKERLLVAAAILFTPVLYRLFSIPLLQFPDYPISKGSLVPDDGMPGHIQALFGPSSPIQFIDYSSFLISTLPLLILISLLGLYLIKKHQVSENYRNSLAACLILVFLQIILPAQLSVISPLASLSRILPGHFLVPLPLIIASLCYVLLSILLVECRASVKEKLFVTIIVPLTIFIFNGNNHSLPLTALSDQQQALSFLNSNNEAVIISPSYYLIRHEGAHSINKDWVLKPRRSINPLRWGALVTTSHQSGNIPQMLDKNKNTFWSTKLSNQNGEEWIHIKLENPQEFEGISLNLGSNTTDWPRGLEILGKEDCSSPSQQDARNSYNSLYLANPWLGPILHSKNGYPFYGSRSVAKVIFPQPIKAKCILIKQTGLNKEKPWSVAELRFLVPQR